MIIGTMNPKLVLSPHIFNAYIPHSGSMQLIDAVEDWDSQHIIASSQSHKQRNHPLRLKGRLSSLNLIEYGAQSMAIHCGLLARKAQTGFLAAVSHAVFHLDDLDGVSGTLIIHAICDFQSAQGIIYHVTIYENDQKLLLTADMTVMR